MGVLLTNLQAVYVYEYNLQQNDKKGGITKKRGSE